MSAPLATSVQSAEAEQIRQALTYRGERLRALALPLGGIGTGTIALAGDGGLRQWQIVNNVNHDAHVPDSFFAIWAGTRRDARRNAVVLQCDKLYDDDGFLPAPSVSDHLVPEGVAPTAENAAGRRRCCGDRALSHRRSRLSLRTAAGDSEPGGIQSLHPAQQQRFGTARDPLQLHGHQSTDSTRLPSR